MLVWATEFPLKDSTTTDDVLELAKKWRVGSPHSTWKMAMFPRSIPDGEIVQCVNDGETVSLTQMTRGLEKWCGFRHEWIESGICEWVTEITGHKNSDRILISIQLHCELHKAGHKLPIPKKPYIVRQMLAEYGGIDGGFQLSDNPILLREADVDIAESIVNGTLGNHLPIIYVSATWDGLPVIVADRLAKWASGMAHVVIEPTRTFSLALAERVRNQNTYGGAVSIYWPNAAGSQIRLLPDRYENPVRFSTAVANLVRRALTNNHPTVSCTWDYIRELVLKHRIEILKAQGVKEASDLISAFDEEGLAKDARIAKADSEISKLRAELQRMNSQLNDMQGGVLRPGVEQPLYSGEIKNNILKALKIAKNNVYQSGRCRHIIDDLLVKNSGNKEEEKIEEELKKLNSATDFGRSERRQLEQLGFVINDDGRHIKVMYRNDPRYLFTVSKTGSDWRGMKNLVSEICRTLFK